MSDKVIPDTDVTIVEESDGHFSVRADSAELGGNEVPAMPGSSSKPSISNDSWRQPNSSRPVELLVMGTAETDGTDDGKVNVMVDEDGGTSANYTATVSDVPADNSAGTSEDGALTVPLPPGAQYKVVWQGDDPNDNNTATVREYVK